MSCCCLERRVYPGWFPRYTYFGIYCPSSAFSWCFHIPPQTEQYCWLVFLISNICNSVWLSIFVVFVNHVFAGCYKNCAFQWDCSNTSGTSSCYLLNFWNRMMYLILGHLMNSWLPSYHLTMMHNFWYLERQILRCNWISRFRWSSLWSGWKFRTIEIMCWNYGNL